MLAPRDLAFFSLVRAQIQNNDATASLLCNATHCTQQLAAQAEAYATEKRVF
jgi:hypothetical protein